MDSPTPLRLIFEKFHRHLRYNLAKHGAALPPSAVTIIAAYDGVVATPRLAVAITIGSSAASLEYSALGDDIVYRFSRDGVEIHQGTWSHHSAAHRCRVILRIDVLRLKAMLPATPPR